jgi:hypothetical protein
MVSQRRSAQLGLLSACLLLATTLTILYRGSHEGRERRELHPDHSGIVVAPIEDATSFRACR